MEKNLKKITFDLLLLISFVYLFSKPAFYLFLNESHNNYNEIDNIFDLNHSYPHRHFFNFLVFLVKYVFANKISLELAHVILINLSVIITIILIYLIFLNLNSKYALLSTACLTLTYPFIGSLAFPVHQDIVVILFGVCAFYYVNKNFYICNLFIFLALLIHELALFSIPILLFLQIQNNFTSKNKIYLLTILNIFIYGVWVLYSQDGFNNFLDYFMNTQLNFYNENPILVDFYNWHKNNFGTQYRIAYIGNFFSFKALWLLAVLSFISYRKYFFNTKLEYIFYFFLILGYLTLSLLFPADDTRHISTLLFLVFFSLMIKVVQYQKKELIFIIFILQLLMPNLATYWEIYPINPIILKLIYSLIF